MATFVVAITGGIACGKTAVSDRFREFGIDVIDTDLIARQIVEPGQPALVAITETFGEILLQEDGSLNRPALREIVFNDAEAKRKLEAITHPKIREVTDEQILSSNSAYCLVVIPLLFETKPNRLIKRVLVVDCDPDVQQQRLMARDNLTQAQALNIINQQTPREIRLRGADDIVRNNGDLAALKPQIDKLHRIYSQMH